MIYNINGFSHAEDMEVTQVLDLMDIQDSVAQVAHTIAMILKVDVEVINLNYYRVAGTGKYENRVGERITNNYVYQMVIGKKLDVFIPNSGQHPFCIPCPEKENCIECAELAVPIIYKDMAIGVFGLIAFDKKQRNFLIRYQAEFLAFIREMGHMLEAKMNEAQFVHEIVFAQEQLDAIIDAVGEGIVAIDSNGNINHCNHSALALLGRSRQEVINQPLQRVFPNMPLLGVLRTGQSYSNREIPYSESRFFMSTARPIIDDNQVEGAVASFVAVDDFTPQVSNLSEPNAAVRVQDIIGNSEAMVTLRYDILRFAHSSSTLLIQGESGTGKELVARAIHSNSSRRDKAFIAINCSAIPDTLLESELFGYEDGAFTGARHSGKSGKFEAADGGTLFLDEIGDMPIHLQTKIMRALQERTIERVGSNTSVKVNLRVIAATNRPLEDMVDRGEFREDLFYRLNVIPIYIPPLRERKEDITPLLEYFRLKYNRLLGKTLKGYSDQVLCRMLNYSWPGNVRELANAIEYAFNVEESLYVLEKSLPLKVREEEINSPPPAIRPLQDIEKDAVAAALNYFGRSLEGKRKASEALGISLATLYRKITQYGL